MSTTTLALLNGLLLTGGGIAALVFTRFMARTGDRKVVLTASVAAWTILFGLVPFAAFAFGIRWAGVTGKLSTPAALIFNFIPFALLLAPILGFLQGMAVSRKTR